MRRLIVTLLSLITRTFFRRIEIAGAEHIVATGGVLFAVNHPNALIDPLFLICFAPRPVSFLAKAPLFRYPLINILVKSLDSIPVYRKGDPGIDVSRNRETFDAVRRVLTAGGAIAIFPEGTTHSDSKLKTLKTGAARMALIAASSQPVSVVPTGIYYSAKKAFRSAVLMSFGEPIVVQQTVLDDAGEPPGERVSQLTRRIQAALDELTLQADSREALSLASRAERIFRSTAANEETLASELELRRQLVAGYAIARERLPQQVAAIEAHIAQFESELAEVGLSAADLDREHGGRLRLHWTWALIWCVLFPLAVVGIVIHWPVYRLIGYLSRRLSHREEELVATMKMLGGMLFFPALWVALSFAALHWFGWRAATATMLMLPLTGYCAVVFGERIDRLVGRMRAVGGAVRGQTRDRLAARRRVIRHEIVAIAAAMQKAAGETAPSVWPPVGNDLLG